MLYAEVGLWVSAELFSARRGRRVQGQDFEEPPTRFVRHHAVCPGRGQDRIGRDALGEGLCLELFEFGRGDRALVEQSLGCGDLFRRIARRRNVLDIGLG